jgi:hypothetical protein
MNNLKDFAVFILTHGRPDRVYTYDLIRESGYTGRIYIIVDNLDKKIDQYKEKYNDQVIVFDKNEIAKTFDQADNFEDMRAIVYARNASFQIAKNLTLKYFVQLDDDYTSFDFRYDKNLDHNNKKIKCLDKIFNSMIDFLISTNVHSIALSQGGDWFGAEHKRHVRLKRKCMNSFICLTDRFFQFSGRINEDVNTYTRLGSVGHLFFTTFQVSLDQKQTQSNAGGMTELYLNSGTYIKSFYTVMFQPSSVKVAKMNSLNPRWHHSISWNQTVPKILAETYKKTNQIK